MMRTPPMDGRPGMSRRQPVMSPQAKATQTVQQAQPPGAATGGPIGSLVNPARQPGFAMRPPVGPEIRPQPAPMREIQPIQGPMMGPNQPQKI
jgi:hypothetical protein